MKIILALVILFVFSANGFGYNNYVGYAGSPVSYGSCAYSCHGPPNSFTPTAAGFPSTYEPDSSYTIVLSHSGNTISNFNACVLRESDNIPAGVLIGDSNTVTYTHSGEGTAVHGSPYYQTTYVFNWTAPLAGTGSVILYAAVHEGATYGLNGVGTFLSGEAGIEEGDSEPEKDFKFNIFNSNPSRDVVRINLTVNRTSTVKLEVYDAMGRRIDVLLDRLTDAENRVVTWKPKVNSGIYFIILYSGSYKETRKVILVK